MEQQPPGEMATDSGLANRWMSAIGVEAELVWQRHQHKLRLGKSYCNFLKLKINC
jgi:hypothetical protein